MRLRNRVIFAAGIAGVSLTAVIVPSAMAAQPLLPCQEGSLTNCQIPPHGQLGKLVKVGNGPAASTGVGAAVGLNVGVTIEPTITPLPTLTSTPLPTVTVQPTSTPLPTVPSVTVIVPPARNSTTVIMPPAPPPSIVTDNLPVTN